jgi:hypothetical protein
MTDLIDASASLWLPPSSPLLDPPAVGKAALLPLDQLSFEDAERLFLRLLNTEFDVERATLFGLPGQSQEGIDVYGRRVPVGDGPTGGAMFVSLQSRRIKNPTVSGIEKAVDDFLAGSWADRSSRFYYATSASLRHTKLDAAVRAAFDKLAERGIEFIPWGAEQVSERLRDQPLIVDDFFGRAWVDRFCGPDRLVEVSHRITTSHARELRSILGNLYRGAFRAYGASSTVTSVAAMPFMVLDTVPLPATAADRPVSSSQYDQEPTESSYAKETPEERSVEDRVAPHSFIRRRSTQPRRAAAAPSSTETMSSRAPVDEWMASARLRLLIGTPGSGKSSFLMFAAADLLSVNPQSASLQRAHAGALPLWLPFAFLCRHLDESTSNSVISAVKAWTTQQGGTKTWEIVEPALNDDRVVLLIDGVDEWDDVTKADQALGLVESFVAQRNISATLTARPYALSRLNWTLPWVKGSLAPLTSSQQLRLAHRALAEAELESLGIDVSPSSPAADAFLMELEQVPALAPLITTPLFLCVLAKSWRGEALSSLRFRLFSDLGRLLIDRHPQMRRRASSATGSEFPTAQMQSVLRGVAYRARLETSSTLTTRPQMEQWFQDELAAPDGLGYSRPEAIRIAHALLSQAEDEYGLLVPQGMGMVGFLHRVLLDQLAGEHLATRPPEEITVLLRQHASDPNWRDVLVSALSAQVSAHVNAALLGDFVTDLSVDDIDKWELIGGAIAAGVAISQTSQLEWVDKIISRTAEHQNAAHRAELARCLVGMTRHPALYARLVPIFSRWLSASHPEPVSLIWALREAPVDDDQVLSVLLWALRHEDEDVQLNAAHALAIRFQGNVAVKSRILDQVREGATSIDQAFALLSLGTGWADAPELPTIVQWARSQPTFELRICALHLAKAGTDAEFEITEYEQAWLQDFLRYERWGPREPWMQLAFPFVAQALQAQPGVETFVLDILANNGRNGGNRYVAWYLACTTFSDDNALRDWAVGELGKPEGRGLILYNLSLIPDEWRTDSNFARSAASAVRRDIAIMPHTIDVLDLSASMPENEVLDVLLPALDAHRPAAAASTLLDRFADDQRATTPIADRLNGEYETAAPLASVALKVLGASAGFDRLVELLRTDTPRPDSEDRVVIARAVADAWLTLSQASDSNAQIMDRYAEEELARRCTQVGTQMLTWHVGSVIAAWPGQPAVVEFALEALRDTRNLTRGIIDPAPAAILRAYATRSDPTSQELVSAVMGQLAYLPSNTREVLTLALTESDLSPTALIQLLRESDYDRDVWVQRAALSGLVRRFNRYRLSAPADPAQVEATAGWLRVYIRGQLAAYGPSYEDRRQNAWVGMLLFGEFDLHDGLFETIGEPTRPGVQLAHVFGEIDTEFLDLLNANWDDLVKHFGEDELFTLLSGTRAPSDKTLITARNRVLSQLTQVPAPHPRIQDLIETAAETDSSFRSDPAFLVCSYGKGRRDAGLFGGYIDALDTRRFNEEPHGIYETLVDPHAWDVSNDAAREIIKSHDRFGTSEALRSVFAERFSTDPLTRSWYVELENWFRTEGPRDRRQWPEALALALRASPAKVLPTIVRRAHGRLHSLGALGKFDDLTAPLLRRLRSDPAAVDHVRAAMLDPFSISDDTPLWKPRIPERPITSDSAARLSYLYARSLQRAGMLSAQAATDIRLRLLTDSAEVVAHDPFLGLDASIQNLSSVLSSN